MTAYRIRLKERLDQHWSNWLVQYPQSGPQYTESNVRLPGSLHPQRVYTTNPKTSSGFALGGLMIIHEANGETVLAGEVVDQAALHGLLSKVRDLHLTLISVSPVEIDTLSQEERQQEIP